MKRERKISSFIPHPSSFQGGCMSYSQLIQFKRLEERAFIFLNGRQLMFGVFGVFSGMSLATNLGLKGWPVWAAVVVIGLLGIAAGGRYRGLYGYQYLVLLLRSVARLGQTARPEDLYDRPVDQDLSYVLGAPDGGALVLRQAPPPGARTHAPKKGDGGGPAVYSLRPVDLAQHPPQTIGALMQRWAGFWAGARPPLRLVVHSTPFFADAVVEEARAASLVAEKDWQARGLAGYGRFLEHLTRQAAMYQASHELLIWAHSDTEAHATLSSMASWLGVSARPSELTPLLKGEYEVNLDHLRPLDPRQPYLVLLVSHEFTGEWSWTDPLVTILRQAFPASLAMDVERSQASNDALEELVKYENVLL